MKCACGVSHRFDGVEADEYALFHLKKVAVDAKEWTKKYVCGETGAAWLMDYPCSGEHGGGSSRLRLLDDSGVPLAKSEDGPLD